MEPLVLPEGSSSDAASAALQHRLSELTAYVEKLHATIWTRVDNVEEDNIKAAKRVTGLELAVGVRGSLDEGGVELKDSASAVIREVVACMVICQFYLYVPVSVP